MLLDPVPALKGGFEMPKPVRRCRSVPGCGGTAVMDAGGAPLPPPIGLGISIEMWLGRRPQRPVAFLGLVGEERAVIFFVFLFFSVFIFVPFQEKRPSNLNEPVLRRMYRKCAARSEKSLWRSADPRGCSTTSPRKGEACLRP